MITDRRGRCRCHHGRQIARTRSPVHMAAMYRRLHRLLPRHPRQLLTDKCFPAHLRCAPDCMSCCLPTCRCTPRGVLHLAASPMRLSGRVGDPAGRRTPCGTHGVPDWPTLPSRFGDAQDIFADVVKPACLVVAPRDAALRPGRRSGGTQKRLSNNES